MKYVTLNIHICFYYDHNKCPIFQMSMYFHIHKNACIDKSCSQDLIYEMLCVQNECTVYICCKKFSLHAISFFFNAKSPWLTRFTIWTIALSIDYSKDSHLQIYRVFIMFIIRAFLWIILHTPVVKNQHD